MGELEDKQKKALNNWSRTDPAMRASFPYVSRDGDGFGDFLDGLYGDSHNHGTTTILDGSITDTGGSIDFDDENLSTTGHSAMGDILVRGFSEDAPTEDGLYIAFFPEDWLFFGEPASLIYSAPFSDWGFFFPESFPLWIEGNPTLINAFGEDVYIGGDVEIFGTLELDHLNIEHNLDTGGQVTNMLWATAGPESWMGSGTHVTCVITDGGDVTLHLPSTPDNGRHVKVVNCGSSGNDVILTPAAGHQISGNGAGVAVNLTDGEVASLHFDDIVTDGWW